MNFKKISVLGITSMLSLALTSGAAYAATSTASQSIPQTTSVPHHANHESALAQFLGIDQTTLMQKLKSGKTLAQIASEKGISTETLTQKLQSALNDRLDKAVASGKMTTEKASQIKSKEDSEIAAKINKPWTDKKDKCDFHKGIGQSIQTIFGMTSDQLKEQLKNGKTLAQIAADRGISKSDLTAKLVSAMASNIDLAVKYNKLTSEKAAKIKANLPQRIDTLINKTPASEK
ncbi:hypothetical protein [Desulfosporosinus sp. FKB]|uniref:hypothetical protein n=1 Tax=Desulfosporosinus sp. FKB TaxID=1969835 RepID=UPI000B4A4F1A|nr:hypothetical protein [Desulfosporosinus sp. FKB]